jgi:hypothetical protein
VFLGAHHHNHHCNHEDHDQNDTAFHNHDIDFFDFSRSRCVVVLEC